MSSKLVYKAEVGSPQHQSATSGRRRRPSDMMILLVIAAFVAAGGAFRPDRTYLPPASSVGAGGTPGSLRAPLRSTDLSSGLLRQPFATMREAIPSFPVPFGGYENDHRGVVVDAAAAGLRAVDRPSGLGYPRTAYGSPDSKVGEAAFRGTENPAGSQPPRAGEPGRPSGVQYESPGFASANVPDLSAFHRPPAPSKPQIQILRDPVSNTIKYQNDIGIDKFEYAFETENGIKMEGNGVSADGVRAQGGYSYTGDDGRLYSVRYTADEAGYRPVGAHLPTPPPVPAEILHSLRQNARDEAGGLRDDGSYDDQKYNTDDDYTKSDANGKYNEEQSNTFGEPSGADASTSGAVVNQNGKGDAEPNNNGQFNSFDSSKDGSSLPSKTSFGSLGSDNKANRENSFFPNGQNDQLNNNRFGSQFQYLPPVGNVQSPNNYPGSYISKDGNGGDVKIPSQKKLPVPSLFEKSTSLIGQSYYGSPGSERVISNNKLSRPSQGTDILGISKGPLRSDQALNDKQYQKNSENINIPNRGISQQLGSPSLEGFQSPPDFNSKTQTSFGESSPSLISKSPSYFGIKPYNKHTSNVPVSGSNSGFSQNIPDADSKISEQAVLPTKIPQLTPTSPVENQGITTFLNSDKPPQSSLSLFPTSASTVAQPTVSSLPSRTNTRVGLDEISPSQFKPTNIHSAHGVSSPFIVPSRSESYKVIGQTQGSVDSYVYNKPVITFDIPSGRPHTAPRDPLFTNKPQDLFISTQQQSQPELSKYPQASSFDITKPTLATSYKDGNKDNIYQTNGVTQASISPFPSIVPTSSSVLFTTPTLSAFPQVGSTIATSTAQFISTNLGDQIYNIANEPQFGQHPLEPDNKPQNSGVESQGQNYNGEVYEYNKPEMKLLSSPQKQSFQTAKFNNIPQFGQHIPSTQKLSSSQTNQQSTPSQLDALTGSKLEYKTTPSQFGINTVSSFDQQTTPPRPNEQAGLPFGQKSTPPRFDLQTSLSVGPQTTSSRFGDQNTPSVGQQTSPPRISGIQTGTSVGPQISQSFGTQDATLFGQKKTSSSFGVQTGPTFGHRTTPARFGAQTAPFGDRSNAPLGQQTTPARFDSHTGSLLGSQTAPPIFDSQSAPFGQKTSSTQFAGPPRPTDGYPTTVSRFDEQTGAFEQGILPLFDHKKPAGQQSSFTVSQTESFLNANQKNDAHDLNTKPQQSFNFKPSTSQQSGSIGPQQSPSGGQSDRQDFTTQHINSIASDRQQVLTQSNKQFPSILGTRPEHQIKPQSVSSFQKGKVVKPTEVIEFASKPINSQVPGNVQTFGNDRLPSQSPGLSEIQGGFDSLNRNAQNDKVTQTTFDQENLPNLKPYGPRPQASFQSACCSGFINQNQGFSQNPSGDGSVDLPNTSFGTGNLDLSRTENQGLKGSQTGSRGSTGTSDSNTRSQAEPTRSDAGKGEQFGGPRDPPRFDATGYHY